MSVFGRMTPYTTEGVPIPSLDDIATYLHDKYGTYLVSAEGGEDGVKRHFHFIIDTADSIPDIRYHLKKDFQAEVYLSGKRIEDQVRAVAYTIKDGKYRMNNIDANVYLQAKAVAKPKVNFEVELKNLTQQYIDVGMTDHDLIDGIIGLYLKYNKKIYTQHIRATFKTIKSKVDGKYRENLIKDIIGFD